MDKVGDTAKTLLSLLFVKYSAEFTLLKRWEGFALAFVGLLLAIASFFTPKGLGIAIIDFMSVGLGVLGVGYYFVESKNFAEQAADAPSTFGKDFELLVTFGSPIVSSAKLAADAATGQFVGGS